MGRLLTPEEAAALIGMNHKTLLKWSRLGIVPAHPLGEGKRRLWRYFDTEILKWIEGKDNTKPKGKIDARSH